MSSILVLPIPNTYTLINISLLHSLPQLMDVVRSNYEAMIDRAHGGPNFMMHSGISQASEYDDPPGLREKAEYLLREWVNLYHSAAAGRDSTKAFSAFVGQVNITFSFKSTKHPCEQCPWY